MRSWDTRRFIEMRWRFETGLDHLMVEEDWLKVPGEGLYDLVCQWAFGRRSSLPGQIIGLNTLLLRCYSQLIQDQTDRQEQMELAEITLRRDMHNKLVATIASGAEGAKAQLITDEDFDVYLTLLWSVQKITNPASQRPQSPVGDRIEEDYEANKELFNAPLIIQR